MKVIDTLCSPLDTGFKMFALALSVLLCRQTSVWAQPDTVPGVLFFYSHPETSLPVMSGLVNDAVLVQTKRNVSTPAISQSDPPENAPQRGETPECRTLINLVFRTADGSCNNQETRGQSLQPFARLLAPAYDDGIQSPRQTNVFRNASLPSVRTVSRVVHPDFRSTTELTIFVMQWGQFMDHEMVSTPFPVEDTRGTIQCCGPNHGPPLGNESRECFPILFPPGDPTFRGTCMEFLRSQPVNDTNGNPLVPRENENLITAFIDASTVYGSTQERQEELRDPENEYLLRTTVDNFPPNNGLDDCIKRNRNDICFLAGDDRVNEQPGLTLLHVVFVRYHNYLATRLRSCRPEASDELIFQQARAIVGAVMQNILFTEWIPIVLGPRVRALYRLDLDPYGFRTLHDPNQDPRIFTSFSTAVFRFGHTLIPRSLPISPSRRPLLRDMFFKPFEVRENLNTLADGLARAINSEDRSQPPDRFFVEEVTNHLFENQEGLGKGFDLVALNMQRGRDHGIPSYNSFREGLQLRKLTSFLDPALGTAGPSLKQVYDHVDDIDLFSGGMSEPAFDGGLVGETFSNMMALQFQRLKFGDRFFFDNKRYYFGFTDLQVRLIRGIRLSHVLCLTTGLTRAQRNVFKVDQRGNRRQRCSTLRREHPQMNYFARYPF